MPEDKPRETPFLTLTYEDIYEYGCASEYELGVFWERLGKMMLLRAKRRRQVVAKK